VLLITTRKSGRWIVPKGIIEPDCTPEDSATREALEEAGVSGNTILRIHEAYSYDKWNGTCTVTLFPLLVTELHSRWAEEDIRKRKWVGQEEIEEHAENTELSKAIMKILNRLSETGSRL